MTDATSLLDKIKEHIRMALGSLHKLRNRPSTPFGSDCKENDHYTQIEYYLMRPHDNTSNVAKYIEQKKQETDNCPG